nr:MarR family transcriptional regulator [Olsenella uli]
MPGQPKVLEFVAENEGCLQRDIARACAMDRATTTGLLARMEETGLVERRPKAGDRRALEVWLTDAGWAAAERVAVCGAEVDAIAHANMTPNERETLSRLLARVIDNFAAEEEKNA